VEGSMKLNQRTVIHVSLQSFGEKDNLCICLGCKESDSNHEVEFPSKRFEMKNGKKIVACEGFIAYKLPEQPKEELLVIAKRSSANVVEASTSAQTTTALFLFLQRQT